MRMPRACRRERRRRTTPQPFLGGIRSLRNLVQALSAGRSPRRTNSMDSEGQTERLSGAGHLCRRPSHLLPPCQMQARRSLGVAFGAVLGFLPLCSLQILSLKSSWNPSYGGSCVHTVSHPRMKPAGWDSLRHSLPPT